MMYGAYWPFFGFGLLHLLWNILLFILIIWAIRWFLRGGRLSRLDKWHSGPAISLLNERYAKGDISKEEYEEKKRTILGS